jgi:hypothetical protein
LVKIVAPGAMTKFCHNPILFYIQSSFESLSTVNYKL